MTRGINSVSISGTVTGRIYFNETANNSAAGSFYVLCERHRQDRVISVRVKVNVYSEPLVALAKAHVSPGVYAVVDGELMNRNGQHEELVEIRAAQIVFPPEERIANGRDD